MEIIIKAEPKEIAALVVAIQERRGGILIDGRMISMFKKDDFLNSSIPYEKIYKEKDPVEHEQIFKEIEENARAVGVRNFEHLYRCYVRELNLRTRYRSNNP